MFRPPWLQYGQEELDQPDARLDQMVASFAALADPTRLRIVALLSDAELTVRQVAAALQMSSSTASRHLKKLRDAGLVVLTIDALNHIHTLDEAALNELQQAFVGRVELAAVAAAVDVAPYARRVVKAFTDDSGRVNRLPREPRRLRIVAEHLAAALGVDFAFSERTLNASLDALTAPPVSLAEAVSALIHHAYLRRDPEADQYYFVRVPLSGPSPAG